MTTIASHDTNSFEHFILVNNIRRYTMDKVIELIVSWIQQNFKNPKLYAIFAAVIVVIALVFPYIDANFFFYNRIEKE